MIDLLHDANCPVSGNGGSYNNGPLCTEGRKEKIDADCRISVSFQKCHQKPKTDVDHNMHILEHCKIKDKPYWKQNTKENRFMID